MAEYKVKTTIRKDGQDYEPGAVVRLTKAEAESMPWAVGAVEELAESDEEETPKKRGKKS